MDPWSLTKRSRQPVFLQGNSCLEKQMQLQAKGQRDPHMLPIPKENPFSCVPESIAGSCESIDIVHLCFRFVLGGLLEVFGDVEPWRLLRLCALPPLRLPCCVRRVCVHFTLFSGVAAAMPGLVSSRREPCVRFISGCCRRRRCELCVSGEESPLLLCNNLPKLSLLMVLRLQAAIVGFDSLFVISALV